MAPVTLRTEAGDELLDLWEFESRVRLGEVSPLSLVCFPAVTGVRFVPACELALYQRLYEPKKAHFRKAFTIARFPWITSALIVVNVVAYLLTANRGRLELDDMVLHGAKVAPLVMDLGQAWRLLTANFLHRDPVHLGLNLFVLFNVGGALENTYRRLDYLWMMVFSGLATMAASLALSDAVTIGASGMVFGALGGIVAFGLRYRALLPARYRGLMGEAAIPTVLGLFFIGLTSPGIDNWAHLGGLAAGLVAGATVRPRLLTERGGASELLLRALPSLSLVALVLLGPSAMSHALPRLNDEHDDTFGLVVPIPLGWTRGATALGASAWFNGLSGLGRASFSAEVVLMAEGADARAGLQRFLAERLSHSALGPDVYAVRADAPADVRIADRDGLKLVASIDELPQTTRLWAFFIPRGTMLYQVVFTWPAAYPRYERVMEKMLAGLRFEETTQLRRARAEAMLFPNSAAALARLGSALHETGELSAAVEALSAAVRGDPSNSRFRVALARAQLAQGDVEQACASAQEAEAFEPTDASALEAQARCEVARGNPALGLAKLEAARAAAPTDARLRDAEEKLRNSLRAMPGPVGDDAL